MAHVHRCKGCGQLIPNEDIATQRAEKRGEFLYCGQCVALMREPDVLLRPSGQHGNMLDLLEDPSEPRLNFRPERARPRVTDDQSPTKRQQPVAATAAATAPSSFEVVEEYEIMSTMSEPAEEVELNLEDPDLVDTDEPEGSEPSAPRRASARRRGDRGAGRGASRRNVKPAGRGASRRNMQPASRASGRSSVKSNRQREVFYRSGSQRSAANVDEVHDNAVDSNVLQSVENKKARRARSSARSNSRSRQQPANTSNRMSRREAGRGGGGRAPAKDNGTTYIIAGVAGLLLVIGLAVAMSGSSGGHNQRRSTGGDEMQSASYYAQEAKKLQQAGDNIAASNMYIKAAEAAQQAGNMSDAERYNQTAYGLKKHSVLNMHR